MSGLIATSAEAADDALGIGEIVGSAVGIDEEGGDASAECSGDGDGVGATLQAASSRTVRSQETRRTPSAR
jgi:hypothetical protein